MLERSSRLLFSILVLVMAVPTASLAVAPQEEIADGHRRPMSMADILAWKRIGAAELSANGTWFAYTLQPNEGDSELVVREVQGSAEHRFGVGELPPFGGGASPEFSGDSGWIAFTRRPTEAQAERARDSRTRPQNAAVLLDLTSGTEHEFDAVQGYAFSGSGWFALHRAATPTASGGNGGGDNGDRDPVGTDLLLRELSTGATLTIGNVSEFGFDDEGRWLAVVIATADRMGNGVQLHELGSGRVRALDSTADRYQRLSWTDEGDAITVLAGHRAEGGEADEYRALGFADLGSDGVRRVVFDPSGRDDFPAGMEIHPDHAPAWTEGRDALVLRIREAEADVPGEEAESEGDGEDDARVDAEAPARRGRPGEGEEDADTADLVIWHWKDRRLQSAQQVQQNRDRAFGYLATYRIEDDRFLQLADAEVPDAQPAPEDRWAIVRDDDHYERMGNLDGRRYTDIWVADMATGERRMLLEQKRWVYDASPSGTHLLYFDEGHFHTVDLASGESFNLTGDLPVPFWNEEDDHNVVMPPRSQWGLGWSDDGSELVLTDGWDLWRIAADGSSAVNLTGNGRADQIRYRTPVRFDPDAEGLDLSAPMYVSAYGEWTKKSGIARVNPAGGGVEMLVWDDASFGGLMKAEAADVWLVTRSTHEEFPDYRITDADLNLGEKITHANPQQSEIAWSSGARLVEYTSDKGDRLQGALYLPADYEPGTRYPTVVYIYERLSQGLNSYTFPTAGGFNKSVYTSNGYAVLMPDIKYQVDDPGMSAVWSVLPALDAAIATGVVDAEAVGLHGHSWGGYQTSFLITQTDRFAAAIAGAPLTNMISMYALIYKNSGGGNGAIFESSQGRFTGGPWDVPEAYVRNSPVYHAANVTTPLVLLHNDQDGAVDFTQGVEYYNTLRRMDKEVVMLQYVGENHGLRDEANRKDYTVRMREFFDHYLRDLGMPVWLREGVPYLDREEHLKERAKALADEIEAALKAGRERGASATGQTGSGSEGAGSEQGGRDGVRR